MRVNTFSTIRNEPAATVHSYLLMNSVIFKYEIERKIVLVKWSMNKEVARPAHRDE